MILRAGSARPEIAERPERLAAILRRRKALPEDRLSAYEDREDLEGDR
jgi:hypothetical protein